MTGDRAALLARIADEFMENGCLPVPGQSGWPEGWTDLRAVHDAVTNEVHFSARFPGITIVCSRSLAGYSLEGGLHRE